MADATCCATGGKLQVRYQDGGHATQGRRRLFRWNDRGGRRASHERNPRRRSGQSRQRHRSEEDNRRPGADQKRE